MAAGSVCGDWCVSAGESQRPQAALPWPESKSSPPMHVVFFGTTIMDSDGLYFPEQMVLIPTLK
jgi:hypothetical protein